MRWRPAARPSRPAGAGESRSAAVASRPGCRRRPSWSRRATAGTWRLTGTPPARICSIARHQTNIAMMAATWLRTSVPTTLPMAASSAAPSPGRLVQVGVGAGTRRWTRSHRRRGGKQREAGVADDVALTRLGGQRRDQRRRAGLAGRVAGPSSCASILHHWSPAHDVKSTALQSERPADGLLWPVRHP